MTEISNDDFQDDGIGGFPCGYLAAVAKQNAITLQQASDLFGMSTRQFTRLLGGPHFPDTDRGVIRVGSFTFYDKDIVSYYAKKYRVGRVRLSLRRKDLANGRRKELEAKLKREKARLYVLLGLDEPYSETKSYVNYVLHSIETCDENEKFLNDEFLRLFGPDDDARCALAVINRELTAAANEAGVRPTAIPDVLSRAERAGWMLDEEGRVVLRNDEGSPPYVVGADGVTLLTPFEWIDGILRRNAPHFFVTYVPQPPADVGKTLH